MECRYCRYNCYAVGECPHYKTHGTIWKSGKMGCTLNYQTLRSLHAEDPPEEEEPIMPGYWKMICPNCGYTAMERIKLKEGPVLVCIKCNHQLPDRKKKQNTIRRKAGTR